MRKAKTVAPIDLKQKLAAERLLLLKAQREAAQISLAREKGLVVETARVIAAQQKNNSRAVAMLRSAFVGELPPRQAGLAVDAVAKMNAERLEEIFAELSKPLV